MTLAFGKRRSLALLWLSVLLAGWSASCNRGGIYGHLAERTDRDTLSGSIDSGISARAALVADDCLTREAKLYPANARVGIDPALATAPIDEDGKFTFRNLRELGLDASTLMLHYMVTITDCSGFWARLITGYSAQDVTAGSTLVAYAPAVMGSQLSGSDAKGLIKKLNDALAAAESPNSAYAALTDDSSLTTSFETVFGMPPGRLAEAPPKIIDLKISTRKGEREGAAFAVSAAHWNPTYKIAYLWKDGNRAAGANANFTYTASANSQGIHSISLFVGRAKGESEELDTDMAYLTWSGSLEIENTLLATPPALSLAGAHGENVKGSIHNKSRALTLTLATGENLAQCESFSALALTENVPLAPIDASAFTIKCETKGSQSLRYNLVSEGDGEKTLRLWAIDAAGNISSTASSLSITLDTKPPQFTSIALANSVTDSYLNGAEHTGSSALVDSLRGSYYDAVGYALVSAATACNDNLDYVAEMPRANNGALSAQGTYKVCVKLSDFAANAPAFGASPTFTLKTSGPTFASIDLAGPATDTYINAQEHAASATIVANLSATGSVQASYALTTAATSCMTALTYSASAPTSTSPNFTSNGDYKVCVRLVDVAGNFSYGESATIHLRTTLPGPFSLTAPAQYTPQATPTVTWLASAGASSYDLVIAAAADCATVVADHSDLSATSQALASLSDGSYYACVNAVDVAGNVTAATPRQFTVDTVAPDAFNVQSLTSPSADDTPTVTWDASTGAATYDLTLTTAADCTGIAQSHTGLATTSRVASTLTDGTYYVCVTAKDAAGNSTAAANDGSVSYEVDLTAPTLSLTSLTGGEVLAGNKAVAITWTAADANFGATPILIEQSADSGTTWTSVAANEANDGSYDWLTPAVDGNNYRIRVTATDEVGNATTVASTANFTIDANPPTIASFVLAGGAASVALPTVTVALSATDDRNVSAMRMSETATYADAGWVAYGTSANFSLSQINGTKTVYLWVKDDAGNVSTSASASVDLDFGTPPSVTILTPDGSTSYSAGDPITISWTCQSSNGLAAEPIATIEYTTDDGVTFTTIATDQLNNDSTTSGHYDWTLPAGLANTPFRLLVSCKSAAGVVTSAFSKFVDTPGWSIFMGDPWRNMTNVAASIANVGGPTWTNNGVTGDASNNIFYVKGHAIMKIDAQTALVTTFAGDMEASGCTAATGVAPLTARFGAPNILGTDASRQYLLVVSRLCDRILKIRTSDGQITEWGSFSTTNTSTYFLTKQRVFLFTDIVINKIFKVDLNTANNTPEAIIGNGTCITGALTEGADASSSPLRTTAVYNGCNNGAMTVFANADASKIWLNNYYDTNGYRVDYSGNKYVIGDADTGWNMSSFTCIASEFDSFVYCNARGGLVMNRFDPAAETWGTTQYLPFTNNDQSGTMALGNMADKLLAHYSLNQIYTVVPNSGTWEFTAIAGQPLSIMGNGGEPEGVAFDKPMEIQYSEATQKLFIRNSGGHLRVIDFSTTPYSTSTLFNDGNYGGVTAMAINPTGDGVTLMNANCSLYWAAFDITATTMTYSPWFVTAPCGYPGSYPPADGAVIADGYAIFTYDAMPWTEVPAFHSNGKLYFGSYIGTNNAFIFESDKTVLRRIAGQDGAAGYDAADDTSSAVNALLTSPQQVREDSNGDLLVWDDVRLRKITITTEAADPKIYTVTDYSAIAGYAGGGYWGSVAYDEVTGFTYYVNAAAEVHKIKSGVGDTKYDFTGTTLSGNVRLALTPAGLLVLQPSKARILRVAP